MRIARLLTPINPKTGMDTIIRHSVSGSEKSLPRFVLRNGLLDKTKALSAANLIYKVSQWIDGV